MRHSIRTILTGLLLAGVASCAAKVSDGSPGGGGSGAGSGTGGSGSGSGTGSGGSSTVGSDGGVVVGSDGGGSTPSIVCSPGIPATTQFRRILNTQYDNTVRDLLGVTSVTAPEGTGVPSSL